MRQEYCLEPFFFGFFWKVRLFVSMIVAAISLLWLMQVAASANEYCDNQGIDAGHACQAEEAPAGAGLREKLSFRLAQPERCVAKSLEVRDGCLAKPRMVTKQDYKRCDQRFCWLVLDTVGMGNTCVKMPNNVTSIAPGTLLPGTGSFPLSGCGEEIAGEFERGARGDGPDLPPLTPLVPLSCLTGGRNDDPRWTDGFCYGIFKQGDAEVCVKARRENVPGGASARGAVNGGVDRNLLMPFTYSDCPRTVLNSRNMQERNESHQEATHGMNGELPPVPQGNSNNLQSKVTGTTNDGLTYSNDPGGLIPIPQVAVPQQAPRHQTSLPPQHAVPPPTGRAPPQRNSTITDRNHPGGLGATQPGQTAPLSPNQINPPAQPQPNEANAPARPPQSQANMANPGSPAPGPGGIKLDAQSTGRTTDMSGVRGKVFQQLDQQGPPSQ